MPTYQYRCKDCNTDLEVVQKFTDDALTECPSCDGGALRKVFNAVGVVFKGSGFYRTDSRSADKSSTSANGSASEKTDSKSESGTGSKSESGTGSKGESSTGSKSASSKEPAKAGASTGSSSTS